jgi:hypothetical protein
VTPCASCTPEGSRGVRCRPGLVADLGGRDHCRSAPTREVHRRGYSRGYSDDPLRVAHYVHRIGAPMGVFANISEFGAAHFSHCLMRSAPTPRSLAHDPWHKAAMTSLLESSTPTPPGRAAKRDGRGLMGRNRPPVLLVHGDTCSALVEG